ncbi:deoxyribose-phosphate aldolase [Tepidimicrobium xylanilyticum]|uniref:Deoxyribose-phosphate aldolase n=1 Tax=Tepidimicrobium xylanilyticum TaxID=1123352 RepID=A0A1H2SSP1_9FIRM|nr:deoxyribose-phosphate aldolase [Tepidimicrobium xylanilyticum]GMG96132.1 deoxyribose-phosphate aldolase [Tepidimicrobium xylanilyticum]SDW34537.1 deoxyribose-phosphate aldolase [Tepidimicrobium xylanilyticum]
MKDIASMIDHTLLKPDATEEMVIKLCNEAKEYGFYSVCVNPYYVALAKEVLRGSKVKIATVVGFPLGANVKEVKACETEKAIEDGADEIDMVINIGALKNGDYFLVENDIKAVVDAARGKAIVKVIIETCLLSQEEKVKACQLSMEAGADFVKTSTGFSSGGATVEDIKLMKLIVGGKLGIKASGGIRDYETALAMVEAGATRIGASASVDIVKGIK